MNPVLCRAQQSDSEAQGAQVLTRGPVHEAFAGMVTFNPEPGIVVAKAPPDPIEEIPPEERPEGDNVTWIPGYWSWDEERSDYLWVSGVWRALPPGRAWIAGYWGKTAEGYQWISGYWADAAAQDTTYLPEPPATVEAGPNVAAPSDDYGWTPGCWVWYQERYAWRPGYWVQGRADWDWTPAHYVWTPRGYIFVGGFWDYPVERRGVLFAPVYFESGIYSRHGYSYSPSIVIDLGVFRDHLFLRPRYSHYYFGDYYAVSYQQGGFFASFSFGSSRDGYDPIFSHQRWEHRQDREWEHRIEASYQNRRDNEAARPPRTWAAARVAQNHVTVAMPLGQLAQRKDNPVRFQPVAREERQKLAQRGQEVQQSRDQRRTLEAKTVDTAARTTGGVATPVKVQLPRSPIVAKTTNQMGSNKTPPEALQAPKPDLKLQPKSDTSGRQPNTDKGNLQPKPLKSEYQKKPTQGQNHAAPGETQIQPEPEQRTNAAAAKAQSDSQQNARVNEQKAQQDSQQHTNAAAAKAQADSQQNARVNEQKAQQDSQQRATTAAVKAPTSQQQQAPERPAKQKPIPTETSTTQPAASDNTQQDNGTTSQPDNQPEQRKHSHDDRRN
ncbi:MAG: hypothetical protein PHD76_03015 [Methylacidiphilales bacterium]|nr:hypothetical protein [Candidatus Methylacidiphilales bacterium]